MLGRVKRDFEEGVAKVKWFSSLLSERVRVEITVFKLLYKSEDLKKRRDELMRKIGEEVYALRGKDKDIYAHRDVAEAIQELERLEPEIRETLEQASEISRTSP